MKNDEKYKDLKHNRFAIKLYGILFIAVVFLVLLVLHGVYIFKSWNPDVVAGRFIYHNKKIDLEVGGVDKIAGFGVVSEEPSRSEKIARGLKSGESLSEILKDPKGNSQEVRLMSDGNGLWKNGKVFGNEKEIEIEIYLERHYWEYFENKYYRVSKAKYREKEGNWQEIEIGWFENYLALFF